MPRGVSHLLHMCVIFYNKPLGNLKAVLEKTLAVRINFEMKIKNIIPLQCTSYCFLRCMQSQAHMQVRIALAKSRYFHFLFWYYYIFSVRRIFLLKDFSMEIIYRRFKTINFKIL